MRSRWATGTLIVLLIGALSGSGCIPIRGIKIPVDIPTLRPPGTIRGSGDVVTEERPVGDFGHVSLTGVGKVIITQGASESLTVRADGNVLPYIRTEVTNGTLVLGLTEEAQGKSFDPTELTFDLRVREIDRLDLSGAGSIETSSLDTDRLQVNLSGAGQIVVGSLRAEELVARLSGVGSLEIAGKVASQDADISGLGTYRAAGLESERAVVEVSGAGDATVWATESLKVRISGAGSVEYYGNPSITQDLSLVGRLVNLGDAPR